jgi:hypothetical protein
MITKEQLTENVEGLTPEQAEAIVTIAKNREDTVIAEKVREIHDRYDEQFERAGIPKPDNTKTYRHLDNILQDYKKAKPALEQLSELQQKIEQVEQEKERLLKSKTTDSQLQTRLQDLEGKLADKENLISQLKQGFESERQTWQQKQAEKEAALIDMQFGAAFDEYLKTSGVSFKKGIDEDTLKDVVKLRKQAVFNEAAEKGFKPAIVNGQPVFKNDDGVIWRNEKNKSNPFHPGELLLPKIAGIIEEKRVQGGAGVNPNAGGGVASVASIGSAKTQVEANEAITQYLFAEGLTKRSTNWQERFNELYAENKVRELPVQ